MRTLPRRPLIVVFLLACALAPSCRTPGSRPVQIDLSACGESKPEADLLCGSFAVPENYAHPEQRQIELFVMVAPAIDSSRGLPPMYVLEGGPGGAASNFGEFAVTDGAMYREGRDVVMMDLRGAGRSEPLHCLALDHKAPQAVLGEMYPASEVEACSEELQQRVDLTQYTTANAVRDLEAVRLALGHEQIDILATSYGTRLALEYMRRHPDHVRRWVGIGALPPSSRVPLHHAEGFQRAFDLLLEECASDEDCRAAYPDLRARWQELLERLEAAPARSEYTPEGASSPVELLIPREAVVEKLRSAMYFSSAARAFPRIIDAAARGDWSPFLKLALPQPSEGPPFVADGVYLSITCSEDVSRIGDADVAPFTESTYLGSYRVAQQRRACSFWPRASLPASWGTPVVSPVPALLITGDRDPITPPSNAEEVAATLENARVVVVPHAGHLPYDGSDPVCVDGVILDFLTRDDFSAVDDSCVRALQPAPFELP